MFLFFVCRPSIATIPEAQEPINSKFAPSQTNAPLSQTQQQQQPQMQTTLENTMIQNQLIPLKDWPKEMLISWITKWDDHFYSEYITEIVKSRNWSGNHLQNLLILNDVEAIHNEISQNDAAIYLIQKLIKDQINV